MADYNQTTDFAVKDTLPKGDAQKVVRGSEIHAEFRAIEDMSKTKVDKPASGQGKVAVIGPVSGGLSIVPGTLDEAEIVDKTSAQTISGKIITGSTWNGGTIDGAAINNPTFGGTVTLINPSVQDGSFTGNPTVDATFYRAISGVFARHKYDGDYSYDPIGVGYNKTIPLQLVKKIATPTDFQGQSIFVVASGVNSPSVEYPIVPDRAKFMYYNATITVDSGIYSSDRSIRLKLGNDEIEAVTLGNVQILTLSKENVIDVDGRGGDKFSVYITNWHDVPLLTVTIDLTLEFWG